MGDTSDGVGTGLGFNDRLMEVLGGRYDPLMRRAVQSAVLYQAGLDVEKQFSALKIFQRKILLFEAASKIIDSLDTIPVDCRRKLLVRTCTGSVLLSPELAWRRLMYTKRETDRILSEIRPLINTTKTHDQTCDEYVQSEFVKKHDSQLRPFTWEFTHMKEFIIYRIFYSGEKMLHLRSSASNNMHLNRVIGYANMDDVQNESDDEQNEQQCHSIEQTTDLPETVRECILTPVAPTSVVPTPGVPSPAAPAAKPSCAMERKRVMAEIREQLDILKEFEGIIPDEEIKKKKHELFLSLPPVTSSFSIVNKPASNDRKRDSCDDQSLDDEQKRLKVEDADDPADSFDL